MLSIDRHTKCTYTHVYIRCASRFERECVSMSYGHTHLHYNVDGVIGRGQIPKDVISYVNEIKGCVSCRGGDYPVYKRDLHIKGCSLLMCTHVYIYIYILHS